MRSWRLPDAAVARLHRKARADRWAVPLASFADTLERSAHKAFPTEPTAPELERYLDSLHADDLALACACAEGHPAAWDHFVREFRPALYRAADALDSSGSSRDLADSLYGELFGLTERDGERRSQFHYFHGRSSLGTWLRAVLSQRFVDRVRSNRPLEPLPEDESARPIAAAQPAPASEASGYVSLMRRTIGTVVARLVAKDRLRLAYYYVQELTLAQIGRALGEHEATVSRNLARARRDIRAAVERELRESEGMNDVAISECFAAVVDDVGDLDVSNLLGEGDAGKTESPPDQLTDETRKKAGAARSKRRVEGASV